MLNIPEPIHAVVIGANGGIGEAMVDRLLEHETVHKIWATGRRVEPLTERWSAKRVSSVAMDITNEASVARLATLIGNEIPLNFVLNCSGRLHTSTYGPERSWRHLDMETMRSVFEVNTFGVALLVKHLTPLMAPRSRAVFASLSARVSSVADNRLGGWYSYRASKTAQNMILKTAALEAKRRYPQLVIAGLHPGTVSTALSAPFTRNLSKGHRVFTPQQSSAFLTSVIGNLTPEDSGGLFAWDGQVIPW